MAQTERTLEQMNAAQLKTIQELTQEVKDLSIWKRFVEFQISDCNMQPDILEQLMSEMLTKEEAKLKGTAVKK